MKRRLFAFMVLFALALAVTACASATEGEESPTPAPVTPADIVLPPTETAAAPSPAPATATATGTAAAAARSGTSLSVAHNDWFATAGTCIVCHQFLIDSTGRDVSPANYWRASMMANAARDPYYLASVSSELVISPQYAEAIENKCSICHMPMAHFTDEWQGEKSVMFGEDGYLSPDHPLYPLARDGVSCAVCHQIPPNEEEEKNSGNLASDMESPPGQRLIYGPFAVGPRGQNIMSSSSGFVPTQSDHMNTSALCATCHELYIHYIGEDGEISENVFPEQTPYSEWLHSDYAGQQNCQDCHMEVAEGSAPLSSMMPGRAVSPFYVHTFTGSNVFMLNLLDTFGEEIGVEADSQHFQDAVARTLDNLQNNTASLSILAPRQEDGRLIFDVQVQNLAGHKLPTSFPSRRAWLHVTVTDANGEVVFESGSATPDGRIIGNDNDDDPTRYEPHYDVITSADQVQIYENIMQTEGGQVTTSQMLAAGYVKDNRLLPTGFDKATADPFIAPQGAAALDDDFIGGADTVTYEIEVGEAAAPLTVSVELVYQSISYRWVQNLLQYNTEAIHTFNTYYQASSNLPTRIVQQEVQVP